MSTDKKFHYRVTFMVRQSENGAIGTPHFIDTYAKASRMGKRWMDRGEMFYVSIEKMEIKGEGFKP